MTSIIGIASRGKSEWLVAVVVAIIFTQSALAQTPGTAPTGQPGPDMTEAAPVQPAPAPTESAPVQPGPAPTEAVPALPAPAEIDSSILMREQDKSMVHQFLLAIAVFFALIAFLLFVSLPPRNASDQN
jgi:hypothetical protein